jgi:hypothetical protein
MQSIRKLPQVAVGHFETSTDAIVYGHFEKLQCLGPSKLLTNTFLHVLIV